MLFKRVHLYNKKAMKSLTISGSIAASILQELEEHVVPGVTTTQLNDIATKRIHEAGVKPAFLGYQGFSAALCASVNQVAVHGAPNDTPLVEGDLLKLDFGVIVDGYFSDTAMSVPVGEVSKEVMHLLKTTREALEQGILQAVFGKHVGDISHAVQTTVENEGYGVVRELTGHGIGTKLHEAPQIPNVGKAGEGEELEVGMVIAIEPITTLTSQHVVLGDDGFEYVSDDGSVSAHFEHTVAITDSGPIVLTARAGS